MNIFFIMIIHFLIYIPIICSAYITIFLLRLPALLLESTCIFGAIMGCQVAKLCGYSLYPAIIAAGGAGLLIGLLVTIIQCYGKISPLLCNFIIMGLLNGINQFLMGSSHISLIYNYNVNIYLLILIIACCTLLFLYVFCSTEIGFACAIYGRNNIFLKKNTISIPAVLFLGLGMAYALAGINGFMVAHLNGFIDLSMMTGIMLMAFTALVIGTIFIHKTRPISVIVPLIGLSTYLSLQQTFLSMGFATQYITALQAFLLLIMLFFAIRIKISNLSFFGSQP